MRIRFKRTRNNLKTAKALGLPPPPALLRGPIG